MAVRVEAVPAEASVDVRNYSREAIRPVVKPNGAGDLLLCIDGDNSNRAKYLVEPFRDALKSAKQLENGYYQVSYRGKKFSRDLIFSANQIEQLRAIPELGSKQTLAERLLQRLGSLKF